MHTIDMNTMTSTEAAKVIKALTKVNTDNSNPKDGTITIGEAKVHYKFGLDAKIIGVVLDKNGNAVQTPAQRPGFEHLQENNSYITIKLVRVEGITPKPYKYALFKNSAELLYETVLKAVEQMGTEGGIFPEIPLTGMPISIFEMYIARGYYIKDSRTKSGWSEDKNKIPVPVHVRPIVVLEDLDNIHTTVRRELRELEYGNAFVQTATATEDVVTGQPGAPAASIPPAPNSVVNTPAPPKPEKTAPKEENTPQWTYEDLVREGWTDEDIKNSDEFKHLLPTGTGK